MPRRRIAIGIHGLPEQLHFGVARIGEPARFVAEYASLARLRSGPRVNGTTQYVQALSQPSMIVMYARKGLSRRVISVSKVSSVSLSRPGHAALRLLRVAPAVSGNLR